MMQVSPRFPQTSGWMPKRPEYEAKSTLHQTIRSNGRKCVQCWDQGFRIGRVSCNASHVMQTSLVGIFTSQKTWLLTNQQQTLVLRSVYTNSSSSMLHKQQVISFLGKF